MEKIIPPGLNYADIKPEAIENQIRIIKYTPMATVQQAQQNDVIRFHLQGNGFYDPYSAYIRVEVDFGTIAEPAGDATDGGFAGKFLDRSAHSLFNRLVIRSQGTELERIEHYDLVCAMINDMVYSQEQRMLHHYEGFACKETINVGPIGGSDDIVKLQMMPYLLHSAAPPINGTFGDVGAWRMTAPGDDSAQLGTEETKTTADQWAQHRKSDVSKAYSDKFAPNSGLFLKDNGKPADFTDLYTTTEFYNANGVIPASAKKTDHGLYKAVEANVNTKVEWQSATKAVFCIPIYSGILGILMPDKKLLPLSLLPLELELTVNPYALYPVGKKQMNRQFTITKCEIFSHTLFFEQELHRSLEAIVAETGIFLHYQTFYLGPVNTFSANANSIGGYSHIGVYLKSIQSVHWTYLYNVYEGDNSCRKLSFASHNVQSLQLRNGMDLIPSEPIRGYVGGTHGSRSTVINQHSQFLIETYKAWNKMHDPLSDSAINAFNYQIDAPVAKPETLKEWIKAQHHVGRCQYALTLEGEELGQQKTIITGKKSVMPFDLNVDGFKSQEKLSSMYLYLKADFICYVRPDLVVTRLGL